MDLNFLARNDWCMAFEDETPLQDCPNGYWSPSDTKLFETNINSHVLRASKQT